MEPAAQFTCSRVAATSHILFPVPFCATFPLDPCTLREEGSEELFVLHGEVFQEGIIENV
jgi:hypothetical protein